MDGYLRYVLLRTSATAMTGEDHRPSAFPVVLIGESEDVDRWARAEGSPNRSDPARRVAPSMIAVIDQGSDGWRCGQKDTEAILLVRRNVTRRGVADAVTALATPHALLLGRSGGPPRGLRGLTRREHEVLTELALGRVNKEIARDLHITRQTAQRYVGRVLKKLRVTNRTEAARLALLGEPPSSTRVVDSQAC